MFLGLIEWIAKNRFYFVGLIQGARFAGHFSVEIVVCFSEVKACMDMYDVCSR